MKRWFTITGGIVVCLILVVIFMNNRDVKKEKRIASVAVMTVFETDIKTSLESIGNTVSNESIDIKANVTELVKSIHFTDCEYVKKGQLLVQLNVDKKNAEKKQIEALVQEQERELKRLEQLKAKQLIQTREFDTQYSALLKAKAQLEKINAELRDSSIVAPFDGFLGIRQVSVGALVTSGTTITTLDDTSKLKVDFVLPEKYNLLLTPKATITAKTVAVPGVKFSGEILAIAPRVSQLSRSISVRGIIDNSKFLLRPGMMLKVSIRLKNRRGIMIPERAILSIGDKHYVFVLRKGRAVQKYITIGDRKNGFVEIQKGLQIGEQIVSDGVSKVKSNTKPNIVRDDTIIVKEQLGKQK